MTIWILALVLLASVAALGYRQGAIRVVFSFAGIICAVLLAAPLGKSLKSLMSHAGIHNPTVLWALAPLEAFVLVLIVFKTAGSIVHRKTDLHYRYGPDELKFALWERLNRRLGLCLGVLNGTAYFVLICFVLFNLSYWTAQIASSDTQTWTIRLLNRLGRDMEDTGMDRVARAVAAFPENYYKTADLAGLLCQNPQLSDRLARYPAFLSLLERDELKRLAQDSTFTNAVQGGVPLGELLHDEPLRAILQNISLTDAIWENVQINLDDLNVYLKTGKSAKYDPEKILGCWDFNANTTAATLALTQAKTAPGEMIRQKEFARLWFTNYLQTTLFAAPDHQAFLHNLPRLRLLSASETATLHLWPMIIYLLRRGSLPDTDASMLTGRWENADDGYTLLFTNNGKPDPLKVQIKEGRLTMTTCDGDILVFDRVD
jgi:uncharacterized membrane protein required for colicin V production